MKIRNTVKLNLVPIAAICAVLLGFAAPSTAFEQEAEMSYQELEEKIKNIDDENYSMKSELDKLKQELIDMKNIATSQQIVE